MGKELLDRENLFIMKNTVGAKKALYFWIRQRVFDEFQDGWKDRKNNPGIALREKGKKVAVIICHDNTEQYVRDCILNLEKESEENDQQAQII